MQKGLKNLMIESAVETFGIKRTQCMIFNGLCRPEESVNLTCNVEGEKEKKEGEEGRERGEVEEGGKIRTRLPLVLIFPEYERGKKINEKK